MNKQVLFLFFIIVLFSGILIGYSVFNSSIFLEKLNSVLTQNSKNNYDVIVYEDDVDSLITIDSRNDIFLKKQNLSNFIWKDTLPYSSPISIEENIVDIRYDDLSNLKSIQKITVKMEYDVNSIAYLFSPEKSNNKLIIYHQGHNGDFITGKESIDFFLDNGYSILAFSMPLLGMNNQPIVDLDHFGKIKFTSHKHFHFLESSDFSPIKFFVEPIGTSLNYLDTSFNFDSYYMVGISGGGWNTVLFSAIDDRISQSYSVAGSFPIFMRSDSKNIGDYEQTLLELYQIANYLELYILSSYGDGRLHTQISNKYDPCCFSGNTSNLYDDKINDILTELNMGTFLFYIDDTHREHKISEYSRNLILQHMDTKN